MSGFDCIWRQGLSRSNWKQLMQRLELHHVSSRRRRWHPTPGPLPGKSHGWKTLAGCSPWGREESDTTEWLHSHFSLSCIGEGNGNPLQCFAWRIPGAGEPGRLLSLGLHRVGHDWSNLAAAAGSITTNKASGGDGIPVELLQIL